jgi:hypothetical protein
MPYKTPVYDRTAADVAAKTQKAYFNLADWLRVDGNAQFMREMVEYALGGIDIDRNALIEPTITTFPTVDEINDFLENIENIRRAAGMPVSLGIPAIKTNWLAGAGAASPNYESANDWERVLAFIFRYLLTSADYRVYCGVAQTGQAHFYQAQWRVFDWSGFALEFTDPVRAPRAGITITGASLTRNNKFRSG